MNDFKSQKVNFVSDGLNHQPLNIDPSDVRLTDLLLGGIVGYELLGKQHQAMSQGGEQAYQHVQQQNQDPYQQHVMPPQPQLPYPPSFLPNTQYATPVANLYQAVPYVNRYFYFWPIDNQSLGYWLFVTYIDGLGIRGYHFNGQGFTEVKVSPEQIKGFYVA